MKYQSYDLGRRSRGEIVEVTLNGSAANVRLVDSNGFSNFKAGRKHQYVGGLAKRSPVRLQVPRSGHWYVTIDLGGHKGSIRSSVSVLPGPLPPIREAPLSSVPSLVRHRPSEAVTIGEHGNEEFHDVFICHASEDKGEVVRPLAHALQNAGLDVWYDEFELRIGNSLRRKIDKGIASSRVGVVVLSQEFLGKGWPNYELDGLVTKGVDGEQNILPVWHNITATQVAEYSPSLADKVARSTTTHSVEEIALEIVGVVRD